RRSRVSFCFLSWWTLHFDTSPITVQSLNKIMRQRPLVIRWSILKQGSKVKDVTAKGR
ncbi:hypothetical protein K435DRAFT_664535, partial [Dendrothele bispora CBS 962.96]